MSSHAHEAVPVDASSVTSSERPPPRALPIDREDPADRRRACADLVAAYGGDTYRLLTDLANLLQASVAYVDRPTVEAHLEWPLSDTEWSTIVCRFSAMAFDEHIGDAGTTRTDWIDDVLLPAGLPGRGRGDSRPSSSPGRPSWR
ncbi:MAG: hypothetical protein JWR41_2680 [Modestobacter sp.]|nr:hypothetical protein [Modestobacter sp.]